MGAAAKKLKALVGSPGLVVVPGVYDCVSAKAAAEVGFDALYIGSYASGATMFGLPDTGFVGLSDMISQVWRVSAVVDLPIIADAEAGFGNAVHVARAVKEYERAGAAAIHIEDHVFGKHVFAKPIVCPVSEAVDKIKAATEARIDPNLQIIGRTDSIRSEGLDRAIERAILFAGAGADMVFLAGLRSADIERVAAAVPVPLLNTNRSSLDPPGLTLANDDLERFGLKVVIYNDLANFLAYAAVRSGFEALKLSGSIASIPLDVGMREFDAFLGVGEIRSAAERYHVSNGEPFIS
jgi:2-methylisocitrate lyase-like PEP mutase family enzyme